MQVQGKLSGSRGGREWKTNDTLYLLDFAKCIKAYESAYLDVPVLLEKDADSPPRSYSDVCGGQGKATIVSPPGSTALDDMSTFV